MFVKRHHKLLPPHILTPTPSPSAAGDLFSGEEKRPSDARSFLGPLDKERLLGNALTGCVMNCLQTRKHFTWLDSVVNTVASIVSRMLGIYSMSDSTLSQNLVSSRGGHACFGDALIQLVCPGATSLPHLQETSQALPVLQNDSVSFP